MEKIIGLGLGSLFFFAAIHVLQLNKWHWRLIYANVGLRVRPKLYVSVKEDYVHAI